MPTNTKALTTTTPHTLASTDLDAAFADFLKLRVAEGDASPHTVRAYKSHVAAFYAWCEANSIQPGQVTEGDLEAYRKYLIDQGYTRSTIAAKLQAVDRFYAACVWRGLRADNPAHGLKAPRDKTDAAEKVKFLPLVGLQRLLNKPKTTTPVGRRDRAILALMALHGLRVAEVAGLEIGDVDLDGDPAKVVIRCGKGGKQRTVYLVERSATAICEWLAIRGDHANGTGALFVTLDRRTPGVTIDVRSLRRRVDRYLEKVGLKGEGISCHSLRHSAATWATFGGAPLPAVSAMLGHTNVATTGVYAKVADKIMQNPASYLEKLPGEVA